MAAEWCYLNQENVYQAPSLITQIISRIFRVADTLARNKVLWGMKR